MTTIFNKIQLEILVSTTTELVLLLLGFEDGETFLLLFCSSSAYYSCSFSFISFNIFYIAFFSISLISNFNIPLNSLYILSD